MEKDPRRIAFIKALIAAAWADGKLSSREITTLSYYLQQFRITDEEYDLLKPLLERALEPQQASEVLKQQLEVLTTAEDRRTLVAAVEDLLLADDRLAPEEAEFLQQLKDLTENVPTPHVFINRLKTLWSSAPPKRVQEAQLRKRSVERFLQQRLLEYFRGRIAVARSRAGLSVDDAVSDHDLYKTVIWAGLLSRVAEADQTLCPAEKDQLVQVLSATNDLPEPDLEVVATAFVEGYLDAIDLGLLVKEFNRISAFEDSSMLLDCLFLVAAADGQLQDPELVTIRKIAMGAGFSEGHYHSALARCKRRLEAGWN